LRERVNKAIKDAGVKTTPHGFRHYRITEWLSAGVRVDDVADMVGSSPNEIRKTYRHWIKEAEDRLDKVQRQAWFLVRRQVQRKLDSVNLSTRSFCSSSVKSGLGNDSAVISRCRNEEEKTSKLRY
jgi:site-specific recombinase XerD